MIELIVTDEGGISSAPDQVLVSSDNPAPTARAGGDLLVLVGSTVTLDGVASSDPEDDPLAFQWSLLSAPAASTATVTNASLATASLIPDVEGQYVIRLTASDFIGPGTPDTLTITATTAAGFAETQILLASEIVVGLTPDQVTTSGNQNALINFLSQAIALLQAGDLAAAHDKVQQAVERTDGCALRGAPDGNGHGRDWIIDCDAQLDVYSLLVNALSVLGP